MTDFFPFSKMPILRGLSGARENRLNDFLECYILCFETTYRVNRINTVVVLYLWGIETWITFSFFILHLICGSVPLRNISHKNFWVFFCDAQLRKLCIRISIFIDGLKNKSSTLQMAEGTPFLLFKLYQFTSKMIYQVVSLLISWWRSHVHIQNIKGVILLFIAFYSRAI